MSNIKFGIIMPCYNSQSYLDTAIKSIVDQTYQNWELIAINDGSTDDTLNMLNNYKNKDNRIKIFSKKNGGYVSAVNLGLTKLDCDYFLLMGSDDRLSTDLLYQINKNICQNHSDCVAFRTIKTYLDSDKFEADTFTNFDDCVYLSNVSFAEFCDLHPNHSLIFSSRDTSKCFNIKLLNNLKYFGKSGLDADGIFSMLLCHRANSFCCIPVDGYYWTLRNDSISGKPTTPKQNKDRINNWIKFYSSIIKCNYDSISSFEIQYIEYFLAILIQFCNSSLDFYKNYFLIKRAQRIINKVIRKFNAKDITISTSEKTLLFSPLLYKISKSKNKLCHRFYRKIAKKMIK